MKRKILKELEKFGFKDAEGETDAWDLNLDSAYVTIQEIKGKTVLFITSFINNKKCKTIAIEMGDIDCIGYIKVRK